MNPLAKPLCTLAAYTFAIALGPGAASAQISLTAAVNQALLKSPRVQSAQDDVRKARAGLDTMKDIYIPSVVLGGGVGTASGITLTVPTIFTVSAQSLVYSSQQLSYVRSAKLDLKAANLALADARDQTAEDAANAYLAVAHDQDALEAMLQQFQYSLKLVSIVEDRVNAHLDTPTDLKKARRDALEMRLHVMQTEDDLNAQRARLAGLTGVPPAELIAQKETIPDLPEIPQGSDVPIAAGPGLLAAETNQQSRELHARADAQYNWRPTISLGAQYGRVSPVENVSEFYNIHGDYNSAAIGIQIQLPVLDRVRTAAARVSAADAAHGALDLASQKAEQFGAMGRLQRDAAELKIKAQLADLDYGIALDDLQSVLIASQGSAPGPAVTPKEVENARIQEREDYIGMINARLDAALAEISYLRESGELLAWIQSTNSPVK